MTDIYYQLVKPIEHIKLNFVVDNDIIKGCNHKRCKLKSLNNYELDFTFNGYEFNFSYRNKRLKNIKNILNFVKKYGTKEDHFEIEKFVFECI